MDTLYLTLTAKILISIRMLETLLDLVISDGSLPEEMVNVLLQKEFMLMVVKSVTCSIQPALLPLNSRISSLPTM